MVMSLSPESSNLMSLDPLLMTRRAPSRVCDIGCGPQSLDGSGRVDYTEFCAAGVGEQTTMQEHILWAAFKSFDIGDDNGMVSKDEISQVLAKVDINRTWSDEFRDTIAREMIEHFDKDGDGHIDFQEWMELMRSCSTWHEELGGSRRSSLESTGNVLPAVVVKPAAALETTSLGSLRAKEASSDSSSTDDGSPMVSSTAMPTVAMPTICIRPPGPLPKNEHVPEASSATGPQPHAVDVITASPPRRPDSPASASSASSRRSPPPVLPSACLRRQAANELPAAILPRSCSSSGAQLQRTPSGTALTLPARGGEQRQPSLSGADSVDAAASDTETPQQLATMRSLSGLHRESTSSGRRRETSLDFEDAPHFGADSTVPHIRVIQAPMSLSASGKTCSGHRSRSRGAMSRAFSFSDEEQGAGAHNEGHVAASSSGSRVRDADKSASKMDASPEIDSSEAEYAVYAGQLMRRKNRTGSARGLHQVNSLKNASTDSGTVPAVVVRLAAGTETGTSHQIDRAFGHSYTSEVLGCYASESDDDEWEPTFYAGRLVWRRSQNPGLRQGKRKISTSHAGAKEAQHDFAKCERHHVVQHQTPEDDAGSEGDSMELVYSAGRLVRRRAPRGFSHSRKRAKAERQRGQPVLLEGAIPPLIRVLHVPTKHCPDSKGSASASTACISTDTDSFESNWRLAYKAGRLTWVQVGSTEQMSDATAASHARQKKLATEKVQSARAPTIVSSRSAPATKQDRSSTPAPSASPAHAGIAAEAAAAVKAAAEAAAAAGAAAQAAAAAAAAASVAEEQLAALSLQSPKRTSASRYEDCFPASLEMPLDDENDLQNLETLALTAAAANLRLQQAICSSAVKLGHSRAGTPRTGTPRASTPHGGHAHSASSPTCHGQDMLESLAQVSWPPQRQQRRDASPAASSSRGAPVASQVFDEPAKKRISPLRLAYYSARMHLDESEEELSTNAKGESFTSRRIGSTRQEESQQARRDVEQKRTDSSPKAKKKSPISPLRLGYYM
eukprot:TRINITY_DN38289_c0_g1_i2.p1 TRINITY_DN38289_c0_g1~~TRINITY_DN38289_c0_g1_i2.p1  ORF type:complete len:1016 (+),score=119.61 TRINITY_DN38289_c0_g1_i2:60-3107(+)